MSAPTNVGFNSDRLVDELKKSGVADRCRAKKLDPAETIRLCQAGDFCLEVQRGFLWSGLGIVSQPLFPEYWRR